MNKSEFNQGVSFKVFAHDHVRADKTNSLFLRVIIERKKREFNLKTSWPSAFFDAERQEAKPRHSRDKEVENVNMIINEAKGRASRIKLRYFTDGKSLSLDIFQKEFENYESRDNFLFYWSEKIEVLYRKGNVGKMTMIRQKTNHSRFKQFLGNASFFSMGDITNELILHYQNWLRKKKLLKYNTTTNALKGLQTYVNHAVDDGFKIADPFKNITLRYVPGERQALDREEIARLRELLLHPELMGQEREVLRKFLFSCYTGIRISDSAQVSSGMIREGILRLATVKGRKFGKEVSINLPVYAKELINGRTGQLFEDIADQTCNAWLKIIAHKAAIKKRLTFHVSRDTFATLFIEMGGDVFTLKEILGHADIRTTQIYIKMSDQRKADMMRNFDSL
jgi:site-specific recombinase XerD